MGISCEIGMYKPEDGAFRPGDVVAGIIKYGFDKDTNFSEITVSLKGFGRVYITEQITRYDGKRSYVEEITYINSETYVDIDYVIKNEQIGENIRFIKGMYEAQFNFKLPVDIPPSLNIIKHRAFDKIRSFIVYYVRIKFDRPGFFQFAKRYKKVITVLSGIRPTLPMEPTIFGERKTLANIFSCKERVVNIKTTIDNCVISNGGKIKFNCEVSNFTNITVKGIHPRLMEAYTFVKPKGLGYKNYEEKVKDTSSKTGSIKSGNTQDFEFEINVPADKTSLEYSNIVKRKYVVLIEVVLPVPHRNVVLMIPVQIGDITREDGLIREIFKHSDLDAPPTYWEAMAESKEEYDEEYNEKDVKEEK